MAEVLDGGGCVGYLDVDHMGAPSLTDRLALLGVGLPVLGDVSRFRLYVPADRAELLAARDDVATWAPTLVIVDSLGEVLPLLAASSNSPDEFTAAHRLVIQPLADVGACVVVIDHLAKSRDSRDRGPSGTLAKSRPLRGLSLHVRRAAPYVPGQGGASFLTIEKDTRGAVRAVSPPANNGAGALPLAGVFRLVHAPRPDAADGLTWRVDAPGAATPTSVQIIDEAALERVSQALHKAGQPLSMTALAKAAGVRKATIREHVEHLRAGGYADVQQRGQGHYAEHVRHYRPGDPIGADGADEVPE